MEDEGMKDELLRLPHSSSCLLALICNRNHSRRSLDEWFAALFRDGHTTAPTRIKAPVRAGDDRLHNKNISFFNQHIAIARAAVLGCKQWAVVAIATTVHQHQTF